MQYKAPIRSQALGPVTLGGRSSHNAKATGQSQHGSDLVGVLMYFKLSVPAVSFTTHWTDHAVFIKLSMICVADVLATSISPRVRLVVVLL